MDKALQEWYDKHKFYCSSDYLTKDIASYLKVSPRTIQRWVKIKASPDKKKLILIRKYLSQKSKNAIIEPI